MIVVTGGAGFIGSALIWRLNRAGQERILVVDQLGTSEKWHNLAALRFDDYLPKQTFLQQLETDTFAGRPQAIVHLGACSSTTQRDVDYLYENNYRYSRVVAEWCLRHDVRLIYASSAATYGDGALGYRDGPELVPRLRPLNAYGYSKQLFDQWALRSGALERITGLKFFNVFGPNEYHKGDMASVVYKALGQITAQGCLKLFKSDRPDQADGEQQRDFVYVKDCVELIAWLLEHPVAGLYNVGTGQARSFNDLAHAIFQALGRSPQIEYVEMPEALRGKYQHFTQAEMARVREAGYQQPFASLEAAVADYVRNYLTAENRYLGV